MRPSTCRRDEEIVNEARTRDWNRLLIDQFTGRRRDIVGQETLIKSAAEKVELASPWITMRMRTHRCRQAPIKIEDAHRIQLPGNLVRISPLPQGKQLSSQGDDVGAGSTHLEVDASIRAVTGLATQQCGIDPTVSIPFGPTFPEPDAMQHARAEEVICRMLVRARIVIVPHIEAVQLFGDAASDLQILRRSFPAHRSKVASTKRGRARRMWEIHCHGSWSQVAHLIGSRTARLAKQSKSDYRYAAVRSKRVPQWT